jgi:fructokinase
MASPADPGHLSPMSESLVAGVELGGTKCVCVLADGPEGVRDEVRLATTTPDETLAAIADVLSGWRGFRALGIASFGPLDLDPLSPDHGRIVATSKPGWSGADLMRLSRGFDGPVILDTDVNGAAFAEGRWGAARGLSSWAYVTVGTGIGVGSIVGGRSISGLGHSEAGHQRVARLAGDAFPGVCPYHGDCVEGLASGPAVAARAGRPADALSADDPAWAPTVHALAGLMHNLVLTTAPERILIGGGLGVGQPALLPRLRAALLASLGGYAVADRVADRIDAFVAPPALGAQAGPLGAVALALSALEGA